MKKNIKYIIFILISLIILCFFGFYYINKNDKSTNIDNNSENLEENISENIYVEELEQENNENLKRLEDNDTYYTVINCIDVFLTSVKEKDLEKILNLLDSSYVKENNINKENIDQYIKNIGEYQKIYTYEAYEYYKNNQNSIFLIKGKLSIGYDKEININMAFIVKINNLKSIFSIIPYYEESNIDYINEINNEIITNNYNLLQIKRATEDYMAKEYFYNFQYRILYDYKNFYEKIDKEYRSKRFKDIKAFDEYVEENFNNIENMYLIKYKVEQKDGYTEYICLNNKETYYTIKVNNVMDYTIILDDYTIKTEEFVNTYNSLGEEEKIYANIEIFIKMLNNKDYEAAFSVLNEQFKQNNFKSLKDFKNYAKKHFFDYTIIESIESIENAGNYYICKVNTSTGISLSSDKGKETFFIEIKDNSDFILSFDTSK